MSPRTRRKGTAPDDDLSLPRTTFDVLVSLADHDRGCAVLQDIPGRTGGRIRLSASTLYANQEHIHGGSLLPQNERNGC